MHSMLSGKLTMEITPIIEVVCASRALEQVIVIGVVLITILIIDICAKAHHSSGGANFLALSPNY